MKIIFLSFSIFLFAICSQSSACHDTGDSNCTPKQKSHTGSSNDTTVFQEVDHHVEIKDDSFNDNPRLIYIIDDFGREVKGSTLKNIKAFKLQTKNKEILLLEIDNLYNDIRLKKINKQDFFDKVKFLSQKISIMIKNNEVLSSVEKSKALKKVNLLIDKYLNKALLNNKKYKNKNRFNDVKTELLLLDKRLKDLEIVNKTFEIFIKSKVNYKSKNQKFDSSLIKNKKLIINELKEKKIKF